LIAPSQEKIAAFKKEHGDKPQTDQTDQSYSYLSEDYKKNISRAFDILEELNQQGWDCSHTSSITGWHQIKMTKDLGTVKKDGYDFLDLALRVQEECNKGKAIE
jgi:hypothetical protein